MMDQLALVSVLLLLICSAAVALVLDSRQRRIDRQIEAVLLTSTSASAPSIRRGRVAGSSQLLHRLVNYKAGVTYIVRPVYVLVAGAVAAAAVFYANSVFAYPVLYVSAAAALAALIVVRSLFGWQRRRFANQLFRQLPDTIYMVINAVRSGLPVNEAFNTIAREMPQPTSGVFATVCTELRLGKPLEEALEGVYQRTGVAEYGFFAVTLAVQAKAGGSLSETLQTLGDTVRQRVGLADRARALAGEVIFSSRALSVSPLVIGGLLYLLSPRLLDLLFTDPTGRKMLVYAGASVLTGSLVIRWIVRRNTTL